MGSRKEAREDLSMGSGRDIRRTLQDLRAKRAKIDANIISLENVLDIMNDSPP